MKNENQLKQLFDYQHFSPNARLTGMLDQAEHRCAQALSDDDLDQVSAAGEATSLPILIAPVDPTNGRNPL